MEVDTNIEKYAGKDKKVELKRCRKSKLNGNTPTS